MVDIQSAAAEIRRGKKKVERKKKWHNLGNTLAVYDYLLQHGAHVDIADATRHRAHYGKYYVIHKTEST